VSRSGLLPNVFRPRDSRGPSLSLPVRSDSITPAVVVTSVAGVLWALELPGIRLQAIGDIGFITVLPVGFFVAVALLVFGFVLALRRASPPRWLLAAQVLLLLLFLYGTVLIAEPLPRYATSWLHAGFTDYIAQTGHTVPSFDARFNWPGFFGAAAMLSRAAGLQSPVTLLHWAPFYFNILYDVGVYAIAATVTQSERRRWLAIWLFSTTNWVGQDYFSPQAFAYLLALAFILILLRWFRSSPVPLWFRSSPLWLRFSLQSTPDRPIVRRSPTTRPIASALATARDEDSPVMAGSKERVFLLVIALFMFAAMVVSHQLTPPIVIVWTAVLVLGRRCPLSSLPFALIAMFALWLSYGAVGYWSGHLSNLFGGFGNLSSALDQNLNKRVSGSTSRLFVQEVRLAFTAFPFVLAFVGVVRRWRAGYGDLSLVLLACAPFLLLGIQSYGGEALLRLMFFALPFVSILGTMMLLPRSSRPGLLTSVAIFAVCMVLVPPFFIARYGNELWDMETPQEHAALQWLYNTAPPGATFVSMVSEIPWGYRDLLKFHLAPGTSGTILSNPTVAEHYLDTPGPGAYLIVSRDQTEFGHLFGGLPIDWAHRVVSAVLATGRYRVVFSNTQAEIIGRSGEKR
jgi:hypothetical protein